tara:strand:- start:592 stop:798 length:207 start_codon:yes stop_codon:yes gene_type:complete
MTSIQATDEDLFRFERNYRLQMSDWAVLPDSPLSDEKIAEYKIYRQALRDLPANTSDFTNPTYPIEPN